MRPNVINNIASMVTCQVKSSCAPDGLRSSCASALYAQSDRSLLPRLITYKNCTDEPNRLGAGLLEV